MARRRARLVEQERDTGARLARVERQAERRDRDADPPAHQLLNLQSQAGNEAVSTLVVQRDEAKSADRGNTKKKVAATLTMDGVRAPQDVEQVTMASDSLSAAILVGPGVEDLHRLEQAKEAIKHATLDMDNGYSVAMTNVHIVAVRVSTPEGQAGQKGGSTSEPDLVHVKLVFEGSKRNWKPRENAPGDEWGKA